MIKARVDVAQHAHDWKSIVARALTRSDKAVVPALDVWRMLEMWEADVKKYREKCTRAGERVSSLLIENAKLRDDIARLQQATYTASHVEVIARGWRYTGRVGHLQNVCGYNHREHPGHRVLLKPNGWQHHSVDAANPRRLPRIHGIGTNPEALVQHLDDFFRRPEGHDEQVHADDEVSRDA